MPARKAHKHDDVLAESQQWARSALLEITGENTVGEYLGYTQDNERIGTHRFATHLAGYQGWHWFAVVTRVPRSKEATVSEVGLLPGDGALLAAEWVPWSERVRPEELEEAKAQAQSQEQDPALLAELADVEDIEDIEELRRKRSGTSSKKRR